MSVTVSPYLFPTKTEELSHGRQEDLLDALLASCQKSQMNAVLPGYGRSLQPYFTTEVVPSSANKPAPKSTPSRGKGKQKKAKGKNSTASSSSDEETTQNQKHTKSPVKLSQTQKVQDANKCQMIKAVHMHEMAGPMTGFAWAGPAFGMAPAASEIPVPSDFLLV